MGIPKPKIEQILTISAFHCPHYIKPLKSDFGSFTFLPIENGWFLDISDPDLKTPVPEWLQPIYAVACKYNCTFILFDWAGPKCKEFEFHL